MSRLRAVLLAVVFAVTAACSVPPDDIDVPPFPPSSAEVVTSTVAEPTAVTPETGPAAPADPAPAPPPGPPAAEVAGAPALVASSCQTGWGSLPKTDLAMGTGEIDTIRVGRHECFDRLVVDIDGPAAGYTAQYVPEVTADGSGNPVAVPGGARLLFVVRHPWFSGPRVGMVANVGGFTTLRSVVAAGSFEGQTSFGVGVRARLPFRVLVLPGGHGRVILDVAHRWS